MNPVKKVKYGNSNPLLFSKKKKVWLEISVQNCLKFSSISEAVLSDALLHCNLGKPELKHAVGMPQNRTYHLEDNKIKQTDLKREREKSL